ncbi:hypothetical protein [Haliangium sp.]|uniref:hypothetical protein n=1 Tax=Haliangium sp. TaxID=2663208 RepID=UPI003D0EB4B2
MSAASQGRRRRRPKPPDGPAVVWRDGVHIAATPIWCDAGQTRELCFVSSAHAVSGRRHAELVATAPTLALLGQGRRGTRLAVPYGQPFTLGLARLELIRSGHCLGGASLMVERVDASGSGGSSGPRVLYAGAVNPDGVDLGAAAEPRGCDVLVLDGGYGHPRFVRVAPERAAQQVLGFIDEVAAAGGVAYLLVTSPSKAVDVLARLSGRGQRRFLAHRSIYEAARRLRALDPRVPEVRRYPGSAPTAGVVLWPLAQREALGPVARPSRLALVSGLACDPARVAEAGVDWRVAWSNRADFESALGYVDACGPSEVFLLGDDVAALVAALERPGRRVHRLGPARQMALF